MISYKPEEWIKKIEEDLKSDYQIGLHQTSVYGTKESKQAVKRNNIFTYLRPIKQQDYCKSIMKEGLMNRWERLSYTLMCFGSVGDIVKNKGLRKEKFLEYKYDDIYTKFEEQDLHQVIVAIPSHIVINGKQYFLGELPISEESGIKSKEEERMESLFKKKTVPSEFIYRIYS